MAQIHGVRPPRVHFVENGVPLGPKKGQNLKKLFEFSTTPRSSISAKIRLTVMAQNHGGD